MNGFVSTINEVRSGNLKFLSKDVSSLKVEVLSPESHGWSRISGIVKRFKGSFYKSPLIKCSASTEMSYSNSISVYMMTSKSSSRLFALKGTLPYKIANSKIPRLQISTR